MHYNHPARQVAAFCADSRAVLCWAVACGARRAAAPAPAAPAMFRISARHAATCGARRARPPRPTIGDGR